MGGMVNAKNQMKPIGANHCFALILFQIRPNTPSRIINPMAVDTPLNKGIVDRLVGIKNFPKVIGMVARLLKNGLMPKMKSGGLTFATLFLQIRKATSTIIQIITKGRIFSEYIFSLRTNK
jgi:hypothetical protein